MTRIMFLGDLAGTGFGTVTQDLGRALEALGERAGTELLQAVEDAARGLVLFVQLPAHARVLRALAREHKGYFTHAGAPFRSGSASAMISRRISAAGCSFVTIEAI